MNKASVQSTPNVMGRARGPRGFGGPVVKAKDKKGTIKRIWMYMKQQKVAIISAIMLVVLSTLLGLLVPYFIGVIIDEYIIPKDLNGTIKFLLLLAAIYTMSSIFTWLQTFLMVRVSLQTIRTIRQDLFDKFQTLSLRFFDKRTHGDLMSE